MSKLSGLTFGADETVRSFPGLGLLLLGAWRRRRSWRGLRPQLLTHHGDVRGNLSFSRVHPVEEGVHLPGGEAGRERRHADEDTHPKSVRADSLFQDGHDGLQNGVKYIQKDGVSCSKDPE